MKFAITAAAGLALTAGASADVIFSHAGPDILGGGQSAVMFSGNASGALSSFSFSFDYDETVSDASWASDMQITVTDPNNNSLTFGGFDDAFPDFDVSYDGAGSTAPGNYGDSFNVAGLSGNGVWTVTITNDWAIDPNPNIISNFNGTLGRLVPTPGALGLFGIAGLAATRRRR